MAYYGVGCILIIAIIALGALLSGCVVYGAWNWVIVPIFHVSTVLTFWQAILVGLVVSVVINALKSKD
jgi:hypothetical protein